MEAVAVVEAPDRACRRGRCRRWSAADLRPDVLLASAAWKVMPAVFGAARELSRLRSSISSRSPPVIDCGMSRSSCCPLPLRVSVARCRPVASACLRLDRRERGLSCCRRGGLRHARCRNSGRNRRPARQRQRAGRGNQRRQCFFRRFMSCLVLGVRIQGLSGSLTNPSLVQPGARIGERCGDDDTLGARLWSGTAGGSRAAAAALPAATKTRIGVFARDEGSAVPVQRRSRRSRTRPCRPCYS